MSAPIDEISPLMVAPARTEDLRSTVMRFVKNKWTLRVLSLIVVIALWEYFGRLDPLKASYPTQFLSLLVEDFVPRILPAAGETFGPLGMGFAIASVAGILIGVLMAANKSVDVALSPYIAAIYATPRIALLPVLILWLGVGFDVRLAIVILSVIFPVILNTYLGCKEVNSSLVDVGRSFNANRWTISTKIVLRSSMPFAIAGIRVGFGLGLIGIIVAEILTAGAGLGNLINNDARYYDIGAMFSVIIVLGAAALIFTAVLQYVEVRLAQPWRRRRTRPQKDIGA